MSWLPVGKANSDMVFTACGRKCFVNVVTSPHLCPSPSFNESIKLIYSCKQGEGNESVFIDYKCTQMYDVYNSCNVDVYALYQCIHMKKMV